MDKNAERLRRLLMEAGVPGVHGMRHHELLEKAKGIRQVTDLPRFTKIGRERELAIVAEISSIVAAITKPPEEQGIGSETDAGSAGVAKTEELRVLLKRAGAKVTGMHGHELMAVARAMREVRHLPRFLERTHKENTDLLAEIKTAVASLDGTEEPEDTATRRWPVRSRPASPFRGGK